MKKSINFVIIGLFLVSMLLVTGCKDSGDEAVEKTIQKLIELENENTNSNIDSEQNNENDSYVKTDENDKRTETIENKDESIKITQSNEKIPAGFDEKLCAIYRPSDLEAAQDATVEGSTVYTLSLTTSDNVQKVLDFYEGKNPQSTINVDIMTIFDFNDEDYTYRCNVIVTNDEENSETLIGITFGTN